MKFKKGDKVKVVKTLTDDFNDGEGTHGGYYVGDIGIFEFFNEDEFIPNSCIVDFGEEREDYVVDINEIRKVYYKKYKLSPERLPK